MPTGPRAPASGPPNQPSGEERAASMRDGAQPSAGQSPMPHGPQIALLYHFCRLQLAAVALSQEAFERHLQRTYQLYQAKAGADASWPAYLVNLYPLDWFLACACLDGNGRAWER